MVPPGPSDPSSRPPLSENSLLPQFPSLPSLPSKDPTSRRDENCFAAPSTPSRCLLPPSDSISTFRNSLYATTPRPRRHRRQNPHHRPPTDVAPPPSFASKSLLGIFSSCPHPAAQIPSDLQPLQHFDLQLHESFWKDHNVQVLIRIRPLNGAETAANGISTCVRQESPQVLTWTGQPESRFTFDHVASPSTSQENLFQVLGLPMVDNCIEGYNSCIFAYGQTGSGKTFTMLGDIEEINMKPNPDRGMIPRIFEYLFSKIAMEESSRKQERLTITCRCSILEIYNEQISDLLDPTSTNLQIHEDPIKGLFVEDLKEVEVKNVHDIMELLHQGAANRRVACTRMNEESSRSHCVLTCIIESKWTTDSVTSFRFSRLNLVDLAGSERQKTSGTGVERLREAANINKSLSTLGLVIMVLVDIAHGKQRHVPYRDSKLTFLLQDSLGGNSKTAIVATVSPSISCANETLSTLKFAQRAKFIQNNAVINEDSSADIMQLRRQIQHLQEELAQLRKHARISGDPQITPVTITEPSGGIVYKETMSESCVDSLPKKLQRISVVEEDEREIPSADWDLNQNDGALAPENATESGLEAFLEEGDQILDKALKEIAVMNELKRNSCHKNVQVDGFRGLLSRICTMAKDVEFQIRDLCDITMGENNLKNATKKTLLECRQDIVNPAVSSETETASLESSESVRDCSMQNESEMSLSSSDEECQSKYQIPTLTERRNDCSELEVDHKSFDTLLRPNNIAAKPSQMSKYSECSPGIGNALSMLREFFVLGSHNPTGNEFGSIMREWDEDFHLDPHQACMKAATQQLALEQLHDKVSELYAVLEDENEKICSAYRLMRKLRTQEKQWTTDKIKLKHQVLRLQSFVMGENAEMTDLQNDEETLSSITDTLYKRQERMETELKDVMGRLKSSENQRRAVEQLYSKLSRDHEEGQANERIRFQKLMSEIYDRDQIFMTVKREMEIALASLQEAEKNRDKTREKSRMCACPIDDQHVHSSEISNSDAKQSIAHMQKQLNLMESGMNSVLVLLEERIKETEAAWHGEKIDMCMELNKVKLEAAERIGEANEAIRRFENSREMIREAEILVTALTRANETARTEKLHLRRQWDREREFFLSQIEELKTSVDQVRYFDVEKQVAELYKADIRLTSVFQTYDNSSSILLEKLDAVISKLVVTEEEWISFLSEIDFGLSSLEEETRSYLTCLCNELHKSLQDKRNFEEELQRKEEILRGALFDLSLLQETISQSTNMKDEIEQQVLFIKSLHEELNAKNEQIKTMEFKGTCLEHEREESLNTLLKLQSNLSEAQQCIIFLEQENTDLKKNLRESQKRISHLDSLVNERRVVIDELESELLGINLLAEQKRIRSQGSNKDFQLILHENNQLRSEIAMLTKQLDENKKLASISQEVAASLECHIQGKEDEVKLLERSVQELESTVNALESQLEILRRETDTNNLIKEDLEMELQVLKHQMLHTHAVDADTESNDSWDSSVRCNDNQDERIPETMTETISLRQKIKEKESEIKILKLQVDELITTAEKQAAAHQQRIMSLEGILENLQKEQTEKGKLAPANRSINEIDADKCPTSPFKCLKLGLARPVNFDIDNELYSNRRRIDDLEELAASRQKEIFRLNKRLAEAETMTYEVIRDLLGVKSDITAHTLQLGHVELQKMSEVASHHTKVHKEELEMLRNKYNEERSSWLEDISRKQAEVVSAQIMVENMRQKEFILKAENKRLKVDLIKQKQQLMKLMEPAEKRNRDVNSIACLGMQLECDDESMKKHNKKDRSSHNHESGRKKDRVPV